MNLNHLTDIIGTKTCEALLENFDVMTNRLLRRQLRATRHGRAVLLARRHAWRCCMGQETHMSDDLEGPYYEGWDAGFADKPRDNPLTIAQSSSPKG
jgi:hypothetical protein